MLQTKNPFASVVAFGKQSWLPPGGAGGAGLGGNGGGGSGGYGEGGEGDGGGL